MNVVFKKCISENEKLNKSFTGSSASYNVEFKASSSVFNPVILIGTSDNLTQYNYASISDLGREYFITDIKMVRANLYEITLHVDVLSTYANELRQVPVVTRRQENQFNMYLDDPYYLTLCKEQIVTKYFSTTGFNKSLNYVLCVAGN